MGYNDIQELSSGNNVDLEILNDLAENDRYFKNIIPDVYVKAANGKVGSSEAGAQMKIQGGNLVVPNFSGNVTVRINFPIAHNANYYAISNVTVVSKVPMYATITARDSKGFSVKVTSTARGTMRGVVLNWMALTQS